MEKPTPLPADRDWSEVFSFFDVDGRLMRVVRTPDGGWAKVPHEPGAEPGPYEIL